MDKGGNWGAFYNHCGNLPFCDLNYYNNCFHTITRDCNACNYHTAYVLLACLVLVAVLIIVGNGLVIASVFYCDKSKRTTMDYMKASLAIANLLTGVNIIVINIPRLVWSWNSSYKDIVEFEDVSYGSSLAIFSAVLFLFIDSLSIYHLLYMSIQRFTAVRWPFRYNQQSHKSIFLHLTAIWCLSAASTGSAWFPNSIPVFYSSAMFMFLPSFQSQRGASWDNLHTIILFIFLVAFYFAMTLCTLSTGWLLYRRLKNPDILRISTRRNDGGDKVNECRAFVTLTWMQIGFTITILPLLISLILVYFHVISCLDGKLFFALYYLTLCGNFVNVPIYSIRNKQFRLTVKKMFSSLYLRILGKKCDV